MGVSAGSGIDVPHGLGSMFTDGNATLSLRTVSGTSLGNGGTSAGNDFAFDAGVVVSVASLLGTLLILVVSSAGAVANAGAGAVG